MDTKRFRKQITSLMEIMDRVMPKRHHFVVGRSKEHPMSIRIYLTTEDPKLVSEGKGRTDLRYVTVEGNFTDDVLSIAFRQDLNGIVNERAVLGKFAGPVDQKLSQASFMILSWLVNGDVPHTVDEPVASAEPAVANG